MSGNPVRTNEEQLQAGLHLMADLIAARNAPGMKFYIT